MSQSLVYEIIAEIRKIDFPQIEPTKAFSKKKKKMEKRRQKNKNFRKLRPSPFLYLNWISSTDILIKTKEPFLRFYSKGNWNQVAGADAFDTRVFVKIGGYQLFKPGASFFFHRPCWNIPDKPWCTITWIC